MTRKKVKLVWIANDSARKASLKKRRLGLMKKMKELITLCGVEAFIIIYSPDEPEPMTWPGSRPDVERLIMRYISMPEMERCKKLMSQESYLKDRMGKVHEQRRKSYKKNKESELGYLMFQVHQGKGLDQFEIVELNALSWLVKDKMKELKKRIDYFQKVPPLEERSSRKADEDVGAADVGGGGTRNRVLHGKAVQNPVEPVPWDQWFLNMAQDNDTNLGTGGLNINGSSVSETSFQCPPHGFGPYGSVDLGFDQFHGNFGQAGMVMFSPLREHEFGLQFPHADVAGGGNLFGFGFPPPPPYHGGVSGDGAYGGDGGSDEIGMQSYEVNTPLWSNNP